MKRAMFTKQITSSFAAEIYTRIQEITYFKGISMGEWIRAAVDEKLKNDQNNISEGENKK